MPLQGRIQGSDIMANGIICLHGVILSFQLIISTGNYDRFKCYAFF